MADLGVNEHHQEVLKNFIRFSRYQRTKNLKAVEYSFKHVIDSRLLEDTYTAEEVEDLLIGLCKVVRGDVETELISSSHINILLLKQLFKQAEKWHLRLQADLSELENREQLEAIKTLEDSEFLGIKTEKPPSTPTKVKLTPMSEGSGSLRLLHLEIERLKEENEKLSEHLKEMQEKTAFYEQNIKQLNDELASIQKEVIELKSSAETRNKPEPPQLNKIDTKLTEEEDNLVSNAHLASFNQQQLEEELDTTRKKVLEVQAQLLLAEQELERKFSETAVYGNMKKMLTKKNELIKELRKKLQDFQIEESEGKEE